MAHACMAIGDLAGASATWREMAELQPQALVYESLGGLLLEQGQYEEAADAYRRAVALGPKDPEHAHGGLAVALWQQGRFAEARDGARHWLEALPADSPLRARAAGQLEECERLLRREQELPRVLAGTLGPADAAQRLEYARVCLFTGRNAAAARLFAGAFAAGPKAAGDLEAQHRYGAACAAALAAAGRGTDASGLDAKERARLRGQALGWLQADLAAWDRRLADAGAPEGPAVLGRMRHWQRDPDLAGVRGDKALAALPSDERGPWTKLWADVAALIDKAQRSR
jgi:tetratricopeptide (TPR) repeat protein